MPSEHAAHRYSTLDGLRGLAALLIVHRHASMVFGGTLPPSSYLAVDFFFVLSGFVIAHAYGKRLAGGMPFAAFMARRLLRLWPLYALGLSLALAMLLPETGAGGPNKGVAVAAMYATNLLMLPFLPSTVAFLLSPAWSLFCEMAANAAYAGLARRGAGAAGLVALSGASGVVATAMSFGHLDVGFESVEIPGGLARVAYGFFVGTLLYRFRLARPAGIGMAAALAALLGLVLTHDPGAEWRRSYDLAAVLLVCPLVVWLGAAVRLPAAAGRLCRLAGAASYPLYVLHLPLALACRSALLAVDPDPSPATGTLAICVFCTAAPVLGLLADRHVDAPLRERLRGLLPAGRALAR